MPTPRWVELTSEVLPHLQRITRAVTARLDLGDADLNVVPGCAAEHLYDCLHFSNMAKDHQHYAVAMCLLRQCLAALNVLEIGLAEGETATTGLALWHAGTASAGQLRQYLERRVWQTYGNGLWGEPWADFLGRLAKALNPFSHYSPGLM